MEPSKHGDSCGLGVKSTTLHFYSNVCCRDRTRANSCEEVNIVLDLLNAPVAIEDLCPSDDANATGGINVTTDSSHPAVERANIQGSHAGYFRRPQSQSSGFGQLRLRHASVKAWLYHLYGKSSCLELCCGEMRDVVHWLHENIQHVVAVDKDAQALATPWTHSTGITIDTIHADMSSDEPSSKHALRKYGLSHFSSAFCHFGIQYFLPNMDVFLSNTVPYLQDASTFVLSFMDGSRVEQVIPLKLHGPDGQIEFSIQRTQPGEVEVFIRSIGVAHTEYLVDVQEMKKRFLLQNLQCCAVVPFGHIPNLVACNLSPEETLVSSLYSYAIFKRCCPTERSQISCEHSAVLHQSDYVSLMMRWLTLKQIGRMMGCCKGWWLIVSSLKLSDVSEFQRRLSDLDFEQSLDLTEFHKTTLALSCFTHDNKAPINRLLVQLYGFDALTTVCSLMPPNIYSGDYSDVDSGWF